MYDSRQYFGLVIDLFSTFLSVVVFYLRSNVLCSSVFLTLLLAMYLKDKDQIHLQYLIVNILFSVM